MAVILEVKLFDLNEVHFIRGITLIIIYCLTMYAKFQCYNLFITVWLNNNWFRVELLRYVLMVWKAINAMIGIDIGLLVWNWWEIRYVFK